MRGFNYVIILILKFNKGAEIKNRTFYSNSKKEIIIYVTDIDEEFEWIYSMIMTKIWKYQAEGRGCAFDSVMEQNINILIYRLLSCSNYIKLPKALNHSRKTFINIQNRDDDECLKCCLVRILQIIIQQEFKKKRLCRETWVLIHKISCQN